VTATPSPEGRLIRMQDDAVLLGGLGLFPVPKTRAPIDVA
jgi:hypothetical protein